MAKSNVRRREVPTPTTTHEGASAWRATARDELALTAVSTLSGEATYYESPETRDARLTELVHTVTARQPQFVAGLAGQLRNEYGVRSASLLVAVEYLRAGGPHARRVIDSVLQRGDEPAEIVALWQSRFGRSLPWALRQGVSDAVARLYTERNVRKYGKNRNAAVQMADVIELVHPRPADDAQAALFKYLLDERHHGDGKAGPELATTRAGDELGQIPQPERRAYLLKHGPQALARAGYPWESLAGWLGGPLDAEIWEQVIPRMGVMALLRNLANFDRAAIGVGAQREVERKITSEADVRASRIWPQQVWLAYREAPSDRWKHPLGTTLELAAPNIPQLDRTLFVVDFSGSMSAPLSAKGKLLRLEIAALLAVAARRRSTDVDLVAFGERNAKAEPRAGASDLSVVQDVLKMNGHMSGGYGSHGSPLGHATYGHTAINRWFDPDRHDRVIIFTDDQMHDDERLSAHVPTIVTWNLAGYAPRSTWGKGRLHVGGYSDAAFRMVADLTSS